MLVIDDIHAAQIPKPSMFLHGTTGAGKSTWATAGGRPLVILTEAKAQSVLRRINPEAQGLVPQSLKDLMDLFAALGRPGWLESKNVDRIVLDSFSDLTYQIPAWIKDPAGTQIIHKLEIQEFGDLKSYALALVKAIQLTGLPSIIIARSTSKRMGMAERIIPDGYGKSIEELPGKLLPTAEARVDGDLGWVIDTTPSEYSQRCGLPWLPPVFAGTCLDYLALIETGPAGPTPAPAVPAPSEAWVSAIARLNTTLLALDFSNEERTALVRAWQERGEDGIAGLESYTAGLVVVTPEDNAAQAENFADEVSTDHQFVTAAEAKTLTALVTTHKVPLDPLLTYLSVEGHLIPAANGALRLDRTTSASFQKLEPILKSDQRRHSLTAFLKQHYPSAS